MNPRIESLKKEIEHYLIIAKLPSGNIDRRRANLRILQRIFQIRKTFDIPMDILQPFYDCASRVNRYNTRSCTK